jgi:SpoIID/LytB domain protein
MHPLFAWESSVLTEDLLRALKGIDRDNLPQILARLARPGDEPVLANLRETVRLRVGRSLGWNLIRSNRYTIETGPDVTQIRGHGLGHNLGLCQAGAIEMGRQGKSMAEILSFYFPGCQIGR